MAGVYCKQLKKNALLPNIFMNLLRCEKLTGTKVHLLTPNVNYIGRTAPLTSKVAFYIFIQQI